MASLVLLIIVKLSSQFLGVSYSCRLRGTSSGLVADSYVVGASGVGGGVREGLGVNGDVTRVAAVGHSAFGLANSGLVSLPVEIQSLISRLPYVLIRSRLFSGDLCSLGRTTVS